MRLFKYIGSFFLGVSIISFFFGFDYGMFGRYDEFGLRAWIVNAFLMLTYGLGQSLFSWFAFVVLYRQIRDQSWWIFPFMGFLLGMVCFGVLNLDDVIEGKLKLRIMFFCGIAGFIYLPCLKFLLRKNSSG